MARLQGPTGRYYGQKGSLSPPHTGDLSQRNALTGVV